MSLSARNQLKATITEIKNGVVNSLIVAKLQGGETLKATITSDSAQNLNLQTGKEVLYIFKASSVIIAKGDDDLKLSATNQIKGKVASVKLGAVNAEVTIEINGGDKISSIITNESAISLNLKAKDEVVALIKASRVIMAV